MKQKTSSSASIDDSISFNKSNSYIDGTEDFSCPHDLCTEGWQSIMSCMGNTYQCAQCQNIISYIKEHLNLSHEESICKFCNNSLFDYDEPFVEKCSPRIRISIRFSCPQVKNMVEKTNMLKNQIETTNINIQNLQGQVLEIKSLFQRCCDEFSSLKTIHQQQNIELNKSKSNQDATEKKYKEIQQKMEDYHYTTYDGTLTWKISDWQNRFDEGCSGKTTSIFSPVFFSSPSGYKMRARLYPNGDGTAKGTHMSVRLVMFKGDYDNILIWPFNYPVTFCLFDQSGQNHHITDITPTISEKPSSDMSIVGGIAKFCPLALIEGQESLYVKDDTIYIKVKVDFLGIPRALVPYTMSLDPGLPTYITEAQRQIELENYKQLREQFVATMTQEAQDIAQSALIQMYPPAAINQQPSPSLVNLESIPCEDLSYH